MKGLEKNGEFGYIFVFLDVEREDSTCYTVKRRMHRDTKTKSKSNPASHD